MIASRKRTNIVAMVEFAMLTAIVLVLQFTGFMVRVGFTPVSLVLIPIALCAMLLGPKAGAALGFIWGVVVYVWLGVMGNDPILTAVLFANNPILTAITCVAKSTLAGFLAGLVYRIVAKKNSIAATFAAAAITPIVNTGVFILGCVTMMDTVSGIAMSMGQGFLYFVVIGCAGWNFVFEFAFNLILAPALHRIVIIVTKQKRA